MNSSKTNKIAALLVAVLLILGMTGVIATSAFLSSKKTVDTSVKASDLLVVEGNTEGLTLNLDTPVNNNLSGKFMAQLSVSYSNINAAQSAPVINTVESKIHFDPAVLKLSRVIYNASTWSVTPISFAYSPDRLNPPVNGDFMVSVYSTKPVNFSAATGYVIADIEFEVLPTSADLTNTSIKFVDPGAYTADGNGTNILLGMRNLYLTVLKTIRGDFNKDGKVSAADLSIFLTKYGQTDAPTIETYSLRIPKGPSIGAVDLSILLSLISNTTVITTTPTVSITTPTLPIN